MTSSRVFDKLLDPKQLFKFVGRNLNYCFLFSAVVVALYVFWVYFHNSIFLYHAMRLPWSEDQGIYNQIMWKMSQLGKYDVTIRYNTNYFGTHFSPIFFLLLPFYFFNPVPATLLFISIACLCVAGVVIYLIAERILRMPLLAFGLALIFFFSQPFSSLATMGFRETIISLPLIALALLFYLRRSFWWMMLCLVLASLCKEDIPLMLIGFSLLGWIEGREQRWRWGPLLFGLIYFSIVFIGLMPWLNHWEHIGGTGFESYRYLGANLREVISSIVFHPYKIWQMLTRDHVFIFWGKILEPVIYLPLLSPLYLLAPFTQYAIMFLSDWPWYANTSYWYFTPVIPFIMASTAFALLKVGRWVKPRFSFFLQAIVIIFALFLAWNGQGMKTFTAAVRSPAADFPPELMALTKAIPPSVSLTAQTGTVLYFYQRDKLFLPHKVPDTEYVLLDFKGDTFLLSRQDFIRDISAMLRSGRYLLVNKINNHLIFKQVDKAPVYQDLIVELEKTK